ncbi:ribosome maturation factor RimP [Candidatus Poriferisodalis sp.]|uniref:ribosome maturation factor RimP n=1 Tax=Candidatus Poriferisodalis sp. TaxID=3101277 RepID=UPI003B516AC0
MTYTAAASRASESTHPSEIAKLAGPVAAEAGCVLYEVQWRGGTLVVLASAAGGNAIGVDALSQLSRRLSAALDAADMIDGRYVLEVSSPGLERSLHRPEHFSGAVGERAVIRTNGPLRQRIVGEILSADSAAVSICIEEMSAHPSGHSEAQPAVGQKLSVPFGDIAKARTTFEWGSQPRRGSGSGNAPRAQRGQTPRQTSREGQRR